MASLTSWVIQKGVAKPQKIIVRDHFNECCAKIPKKGNLLLILGLASNFVFNPKHFMEVVNFVFERE